MRVLRTPEDLLPGCLIYLCWMCVGVLAACLYNGAAAALTTFVPPCQGMKMSATERRPGAAPDTPKQYEANNEKALSPEMRTAT